MEARCAHDRVARNLLEDLVAEGASGKGEAARIKWIAIHHFTNLIAEKVGFDVEGVRCGA